MADLLTDTRDDLEPVRTRRPYVVVVGLVAALVAAGLGTWLALRPDAPTLLGGDSGTGFIADPVPVAQAAGVIGLSLPGRGDRDEILIFHGVPRVHFSKNTADATARVAVCVQPSGRTPIGAGLARELDSYCTEVHYVTRGTHLRWHEIPGNNPYLTEYLVLVVTPTKPGTATVDRVTYDYEEPTGESGTDVGTVHYTVKAS